MGWPYPVAGEVSHERAQPGYAENGERVPSRWVIGTSEPGRAVGVARETGRLPDPPAPPTCMFHVKRHALRETWDKRRCSVAEHRWRCDSATQRHPPGKEEEALRC